MSRKTNYGRYGDRIVHAIKFFQQHGIEVEDEKGLDVEWGAEQLH